MAVPVLAKFPVLNSVGGSESSRADDPTNGPPTSLESVVSTLKN
jgi:hypothetical protein